MQYFGESVEKAIQAILDKFKIRNKPFFSQLLQEYTDALEELVVRRFRTKLRLRCGVCGHITEFRTDKPMICEVCHEGLHWTCHHCGTRFTPEQAELCPTCHWFKCPNCGSCGCQHPLKSESKQPVAVHDFM